MAALPRHPSAAKMGLMAEAGISSAARAAASGVSADGESGFTLVELLVALTLLAFVSVLIFGALRFGIRAWDQSEQVAVQVDDVSVAQALLRRLIGEAYPMFIPDPARPRLDFDGGSDRLSLLAPLPDALESGGMARFTLFARERKGRSEIDIAWRPELMRDGDAGADPREETLLAGIARLEIAYFGSARPGDAPAWHDRWTERAVLPALVRVHVAFAEGDRRVWPDLVVAPHLTVDQGCLYDPVTRHCRGR
jgi:general secretion pathway protein J